LGNAVGIGNYRMLQPHIVYAIIEYAKPENRVPILSKEVLGFGENGRYR
jgi:hypothetical protein